MENGNCKEKNGLNSPLMTETFARGPVCALPHRKDSGCTLEHQGTAPQNDLTSSRYPSEVETSVCADGWPRLLGTVFAHGFTTRRLAPGSPTAGAQVPLNLLCCQILLSYAISPRTSPPATQIRLLRPRSVLRDSKSAKVP